MTVSSTSSQRGLNVLSSWIGNPTNIPHTLCSWRSVDSCEARCCGSTYVLEILNNILRMSVNLPSMVYPFFLTNVPNGFTSCLFSSDSAIPILCMLDFPSYVLEILTIYCQYEAQPISAIADVPHWHKISPTLTNAYVMMQQVASRCYPGLSSRFCRSSRLLIKQMIWKFQKNKTYLQATSPTENRRRRIFLSQNWKLVGSCGHLICRAISGSIPSKASLG